MKRELMKELITSWRETTQMLKAKLKPILQEYDLTKVDAKVIMIVKKKDAKTKAEIAKYLNFEPASLTRSIDRLVARKILNRFEDEQDKRYVRIELSQQGEQLAKEFKKKFINIWKLACDGATEEEIIAFTKLLKHFKNNLHEI